MAVTRIDISSLLKTEQAVNEELKNLTLDKGSEFFSYARNLLWEALGTARTAAVSSARSAMTEDVRGATAAIHQVNYKDRLGGNINILQSRRRYGDTNPSPKAPGDERIRTISARTEQLRSYGGRDAGFILRFLNAGTDVRVATADDKGRGSGATYGARGAIGARNFFDSTEGTLTQAGEDMIRKVVEEASRRWESIG